MTSTPTDIAERALMRLEKTYQRVAELETALREIDRVENDRTIPDHHGKMTEACNETCLNECGALARKALAGKPLPNRPTT